MDVSDIAAIILPVFGIIGAGYLSRYVGLLDDRATDGLSSFAYTIAIPCLLFTIIAGDPWPDVSPWSYWTTYFAGVAAAWIGAMVAVILWLKRDWRTGIVAGFTAGQANTVLVGIPLVLAVYGEAGNAPLVVLLSIHLPLMMTVAAVLMEFAKNGGANWVAAFTVVIRNIATHPIIVGLMLGALWRAFGLPMPKPAEALVDAVAGTAGPVALFSLGLALRRYGVAGDMRATLSLTTLKLAVHPAIVWVLGQWVFGLPPAWLGAAMLLAAAPCGVNGYLVASNYGTGIRMSSSAIAVSSAVAVFSCAVWLRILPQP